MKRIFVQVGIALVGMIAWLLPNQAKADFDCNATVGGISVTWSCRGDDQCHVKVILTNPPHFIVSCV